MKDISKFIVDNWQWIVTAVLSIIIFILQLCKKRPLAQGINKVFDGYLAWNFPHDMNYAETRFPGDGAAKKQYVINKCLEYVSKSIELDDYYKKMITNSISIMIENALSVPRKKD